MCDVEAVGSDGIQGEQEIRHQVGIGVVAMPKRVFTATDVTLVVRVACDQGCPMEGATLTASDPDGDVVFEGSLVWDEQVGEACLPMTLHMPDEPGTYTWGLTCVPRADEAEGEPTDETEPGNADVSDDQDGEGAKGEEPMPPVHEPVSCELVLTVEPHMLSVVAWGIPSPAVAGDTVRVNLGLTCSAGCDLGGSEAVIEDAQTGACMARAVLDTQAGSSNTMWQGCCDAQVPADPGMHTWTVRVTRIPEQGGHELPGPKRYPFAVVTEKPTCPVTVVVRDHGDGEGPLDRAKVTFVCAGAPPYRGVTGPDGVCTVVLPPATYDVYATAPDHGNAKMEQVEVDDCPVEVSLVLNYAPEM